MVGLGNYVMYNPFCKRVGFYFIWSPTLRLILFVTSPKIIHDKLIDYAQLSCLYTRV